MIRPSPFNAQGLTTALGTAATLPNAAVGEICEFCTPRFRIVARYDDPWKTPITLQPLLVEYTAGGTVSEGGRTQALSTFGLQDGLSINPVRPYLGTSADRAPRAGAITARLVPEGGADPAALEAQIIADLAAFARSMETAMQPWNDRWQNEGWLGLFSSLGTSIATGFDTWMDGEGEFWSSLTTWLSSLPDQLGAAWDSLSESAKALWTNRDKILGLLQNLAEGSVAAFEAGLEAVAAALQNIPGLGEIATILHDLVANSAEWAGAMIEMATQTRVLSVLGFTMLGTIMLIPPNFWTDMIGLGVGYLIPEVFIAIVLGIISFFTAGTAGALLVTRITAYTARITAALSRGGRAGGALMAVFAMMTSISGKMIDLIRALKGRIDEVAEGFTNSVTRITRRTGRRVRDPAELPCFNQPPNATPQEFRDQLAEQEAAINNSDLSELIRRRALVQTSGTGALRDAAAQATARNQWLQNKVTELAQTLSLAEARRQAQIEASALDATHVLDIVAGGDPSAISGLQNSSANRSIGAQWYSRVSALDTALGNQARQGAVKAHVRLKPC